MSDKAAPNMLVSCGLCAGGFFLDYYIFRSNGWHSGVPLTDIFKILPLGTRAIALIGFIACAYGMGAVIENLRRKKASGVGN